MKINYKQYEVNYFKSRARAQKKIKKDKANALASGEVNVKIVTFLLQLWHQTVKHVKRSENHERQLYGFSSFV